MSDRCAAATALAGGATQQVAAAAGHVRPRTIRRWLDDPTFRRLVATAQRAAFSEAVGVLTAASAEAARRLVALACEPHGNASVRLGAARSVLAYAHDYGEVVELERRVDRLEDIDVGQIDFELQRLVAEWRRNLEADLRREGET
jgi:hypothetical protein